MKCSNCGDNIEKSWAYCPSCGFSIDRRFFEDIFSRIKREFRGVDRETKNLEKEVEAFDLSPFFKKTRTGGFSIRIYTGGDRQPQVYVKTFGNVNKDQIEKAVYNQLGMEAKRVSGVQELRKRATEIQKEEKKIATSLKYTEEPKTAVRSLVDRVIVDIEMPGIKSLGEISMHELENSVEVKAVIGDRAFFKILTKPPQFRLVQKTFSNNMLHLEFA